MASWDFHLVCPHGGVILNENPRIEVGAYRFTLIRMSVTLSLYRAYIHELK